jgi:hypothetical protein
VFWDGLGEDGSEDLPVRFGAAAVCRRGVGGQVATVVGAEAVVAIGEVSHPVLKDKAGCISYMRQRRQHI